MMPLQESPEALQQQGDQHLAAHQHKEAVASYDKALLALQQPEQQKQQSQPQPEAQAELCQFLLSVLLNLSAANLQLQQPMPALLYATAAAALSSHQNSKAYYRAAVALDQILGANSNTSSSVSSVSSSGDVALGPAGAGRLAAAATALMDSSVRLAGSITPAGKRQMVAALTSVAAARGKGSSKKRVMDDGEWEVVCGLLSSGASGLFECFPKSSSSSSSSSGSGHADVGAAVSAAGMAKELGNAAFKQGDSTTALQHYLAAQASLLSSLGSIPSVLSSRARAWLQQPGKHSQQHAVMDALAAVLLQPACAGFCTAAEALLQLEQPSGAEAVCGLGLQLLPDAAEIQELLQRCRAAAAAAEAAAAAAAAAETATAAGSSGSSSGSKLSKGKKQSGSSSSGRMPTPGMTERKLKEWEREGTADLEQQMRLNQQMELLSVLTQGGGRGGGRGGRGGASGRGRGRDGAEARKMAVFTQMFQLDERVPKLHEEFAKAKRWPPQIDVDRASRKLLETYQSARALPSQFLGCVQQATPTPLLFAKRLQSLDKDRMVWLAQAQLGEVSFRKEFPPYGGGWQSFVNAPSRKEVLSLGSTHVAIGFVDLGGLAAACESMVDREPAVGHLAELGFSSDPAELGVTAEATGSSRGGCSGDASGPSSSSGGSNSVQVMKSAWAQVRSRLGIQSLRWVGYERSAYCVGKTLVLLTMVEQGAAVDELLQVWYSAAWSSETLESFRRAVAELLTTASSLSSVSPEQRQAVHPSADALVAPDVLELLRHWQEQQVTLAAARSSWLDNMTDSFSRICNFTRKIDRLAFTEVMLTGELSALGPGDTGSVVMFAVPEKFGERAFDECFLQCFPFQTLMEVWQAQPASDIVAVGVHILRSRVRLLAGMLRAGVVTAEVWLGEVLPSNTSVIASIRSLEPYTISWSNVPDFMPPADFHKLAKAVSAPNETVHYMHSMNWVLNVKGACHLDFTMVMPEEKLLEMMPFFKQAGEMTVAMGYQGLGLQKLLLCPPVDNPRSIVDFCLYVKYAQNFVDAFFARPLSGMRSVARQMHVVEPIHYSFLARTNSTMHITFTYDDKVKFSLGDGT